MTTTANYVIFDDYHTSGRAFQLEPTFRCSFCNTLLRILPNLPLSTVFIRPAAFLRLRRAAVWRSQGGAEMSQSLPRSHLKQLHLKFRLRASAFPYIRRPAPPTFAHLRNLDLHAIAAVTNYSTIHLTHLQNNEYSLMSNRRTLTTTMYIQAQLWY